jgi:predicted transcriptional regulator
MQDESIPDPARSERECDSAVLALLLEEEHTIWSIAEIGQTLGSHVNGVDAVNRLHAAGLVHRLGDYVFATRAAASAWAVAG